MTNVVSYTWGNLKGILSRVSPVYAAFFGSLLLSLIANRTSATLNRDGMLYVDTARNFLDAGLDSALATFNWPFLPILMACVSKLTGLGLETSGHLINALFLAGACGLMVNCAGRKFPEAVWPTCLVLLSLPGLNHYRNELLREYGCWFFFMLSFWLAMRWSDMPRLGTALAAQLALGVAALFRPEALTFFPVLTIWQFFAAPRGERWRRILVISSLPLLGLATLAMIFLTGQLEFVPRLAGELNRINFANFDAKAQALAAALIPYARDRAGTILFFGSIAIIPLKSIEQLGIFIVPVLFLFSAAPVRSILVRWQPFSWAFLAHLLVLGVFVLDLQFLAGRYVIVLQLLAVPVIGYSTWLLMARLPHLKHFIIIVSIIAMTSNVVTLNPGKQHFIQAGSWLAQNATDSPRIYMESPRAAYYAGWRFSGRKTTQDRSLLPESLATGSYDLVVLETSDNEADIAPWLESIGLREIQRFGRADRELVVIAEPTPKASQDKASKTERIREKIGAIE